MERLDEEFIDANEYQIYIYLSLFKPGISKFFVILFCVNVAHILPSISDQEEDSRTQEVGDIIFILFKIYIVKLQIFYL